VEREKGQRVVTESIEGLKSKPSDDPVEDAVVLAELLAKDEPLAKLLDAFMIRRYDRCKFICDSSVRLGEWEQHLSPDDDTAGVTAKMFQVVAQPI